LHHQHLIGRVEDLGAGAFMPLYRNKSISDHSTRLVFVDIDEMTWREWGMAPWVPRDKLKELIARAALAEPELIVVDVDLAYPYCGRGGLADGVKTNADLVRDVLRILDDRPDLHVILMQSAAPGAEESRAAEFPCASEFPAPKQPRLHWVVPTVRADVDLVVRDWPLRGGQNANLGIGPISRAVRLLHRGPVDEKEERCVPCAEEYRKEPTSAAFDKLARCLPDDLDRDGMIVFTLPWNLGSDEAWPALPDGTRLLTRISAGLLAQAEEVETLSGRIVVIGGSYVDSWDYHLTPIGVMPGAMVIINAIHSHLEFGAVHAPASGSTCSSASSRSSSRHGRLRRFVLDWRQSLAFSSCSA
jgi:CHASE2 domain